MNPPPLLDSATSSRHKSHVTRHLLLVCFTVWLIFTEKYLFNAVNQANHDAVRAWIARHRDEPRGLRFQLEPAPTPNPDLQNERF